MFSKAVFQGGGVKGIALVGALKKLEEFGMKFQGVGGTSAGSIVAALYASGYSALEMKNVLLTTPFEKLLDSPKFSKYTFIHRKGLHRGKKIYEWMYDLLNKKGIKSFQDLKNIDLKIVASDLTNRELVIFDSHKTPTMKIAEAVRMSSSIPLFFEPYKLGEKLIVDGGILSNYPLPLFDDLQSTLGFKLVSTKNAIPQAPNSFIGYMWSIIRFC